MNFELPASVEEELRALAVTQSRDMGEILEEAVRLYIEATNITDLDAEEVALRDVHHGLADVEAEAPAVSGALFFAS